jgi:hypothetical protein
MSTSYKVEYIRRRYIKLKLDAIDYKGGCCIKCGYDACPAAMVFHHRDPSKKELEWKRLKRRSWAFIMVELDKCDLMCNRCHAEHHWDPKIVDEAINWLNNKRLHRESMRINDMERNGKCKFCNKSFIRTSDRHQRFCSLQCSHKMQERIDWPPTDKLREMVGKSGQVQVGKMLGVSPNAVKYRIDKH